MTIYWGLIEISKGTLDSNLFMYHCRVFCKRMHLLIYHVLIYISNFAIKEFLEYWVRDDNVIRDGHPLS